MENNRKILYFLTFVASSALCVYSAKSIKSHEKIQDIIHDSFSPKIIEKYSYSSDIMVFLQLLFSLWKLPFDSIHNIIKIMTIIQLMRAVCMKCTVLPPLKTYGEKMRFLGTNGSGTEYIFSGHSSYSAASFIYLFQAFPEFRKFLIIYNIISQFLIASTKNHYTIDVVLAWIIVPLVYKAFFY